MHIIIYLFYFNIYFSDTTASSSAPSTRRSDVFAQNTELNTSVSTVLETTGINVVPETLMNETTLSGNVS